MHVVLTITANISDFFYHLMQGHCNAHAKLESKSCYFNLIYSVEHDSCKFECLRTVLQVNIILCLSFTFT
jgi:hypothetical protein